MAKLELSEETKAGMEAVGQADLLIAVAAPVQADQLQAAVAKAMLGAGSLSSLRTVVAFPGVSGAEAASRAGVELDTQSQPPDGDLCLTRYPPATPREFRGWPASGTYQGLFAMARELGVSACAVIGFDLAALESNFLAADGGAGARTTLRSGHASLCDGEV